MAAAMAARATRGGKDQSTPGSAGNPILDGSDDDVVARRLRKAAEAETDPELKRKALEGIHRVQEKLEVTGQVTRQGEAT